MRGFPLLGGFNMYGQTPKDKEPYSPKCSWCEKDYKKYTCGGKK